MTTGKNPDFVIIDEVSPLVEADFAQIEERVLAAAYEIKVSRSSHRMSLAIDFGHDMGSYQTIIDRYSKPKVKTPYPNKRAKTKAARKQRRKQK